MKLNIHTLIEAHTEKKVEKKKKIKKSAVILPTNYTTVCT